MNRNERPVLLRFLPGFKNEPESPGPAASEPDTLRSFGYLATQEFVEPIVSDVPIVLPAPVEQTAPTGRDPDCPYCVRLHPDERCTCVPSVNDPFGAAAERDDAMRELDEAIGDMEQWALAIGDLAPLPPRVTAVRAAFDRLRGSAK